MGGHPGGCDTWRNSPLTAPESFAIFLTHLSPVFRFEIRLPGFSLAAILIDRLTLTVLGQGRWFLIRT